MTTTKKNPDSGVSQEEFEAVRRRVEFLERELIATRKRLDILERSNVGNLITDLGFGNIGKSLKDINKHGI